MRNHILMSTAALLALSTSPAFAQGGPAKGSDETATRLDEIVVTAQKREENIQTVPLSIMSVSGEALNRSGINDPTALQKLVPTLQINNTLFGSGVVIRIRGFGSAANTAVDSDVASYVDGAYVPRPGALLTSFLDVKNVEVLSGPQGTLFGRNAAMGAISINTNAPSTTERSLALTAEAGRFGTVIGSAVINQPFGEQFGVRLAIKGSHTGGMFKNLFDGKTYGDREGLVMRLSTKAVLAPNLTWILRGDYTKTTGDGVYPGIVYTRTADPAALTALNAFVTNNGGKPLVYSDNPSYTINQFMPAPSKRIASMG
jgi:iron complex outermembrane receptor protein